MNSAPPQTTPDHDPDFKAIFGPVAAANQALKDAGEALCAAQGGPLRAIEAIMNDPEKDLGNPLMRILLMSMFHSNREKIEQKAQQTLERLRMLETVGTEFAVIEFPNLGPRQQFVQRCWHGISNGQPISVIEIGDSYSPDPTHAFTYWKYGIRMPFMTLACQAVYTRNENPVVMGRGECAIETSSDFLIPALVDSSAAAHRCSVAIGRDEVDRWILSASEWRGGKLARSTIQAGRRMSSGAPL